MEETQKIGDRLLLLRKELGLSQQEIADRLDLSVRGWQKIERNEAIPSGDTLLRCEAIGYNPGWILTGFGPILMSDIRSPVSSTFTVIIPAIFSEVKDAVHRLNNAEGIYLRADEHELETIRWYNKLVSMADGDMEESKLRSRLPAIEYEITESAKAAASEPGTGKRMA